MHSPLLYIVLIGLILVVYARFLPKNNPAAGQVQALKEFEETMESFAVDMESENRELVQLISSMRREHELQTAVLSGRIEKLEKQLEEQSRVFKELTARAPVQEGRDFSLSAQSAAGAVASRIVPQARMDEPKPAESAVPGSGTLMRIKERYVDLFELHNQGKSVDFIARKLDMNRGEVNLILQLARQEERLNV